MFEEGSMALRKHILEKQKLDFFYSFENRKGLFHDVDSRYKFALLGVDKSGKTDEIKSFFYKTDPVALDDPSQTIIYSYEVLKRLSHVQHALMEVRSNADLVLLDRLYAKFSPLDLNWLDFRNELHMTADKDIFKPSKQVGDLPLYEGKMIWQFNPNHAKPTRFLDKNSFDERLTSKEIGRLVDDIYPLLNTTQTPKIKAVLTALKLPYNDKFCGANNDLLLPLIRRDREFYRLVFRDVGSDTNERSLASSILPKNCGYGHTLWGGIPKRYTLVDNAITINETSLIKLLFAMSIFNSIVADYIMRNMVQIHVSKTYLVRLPMPQPSDEEIMQNDDYRSLVINAAKLTFSFGGEPFREIIEKFGIQESAVPKGEKAVDFLKIENDLIVAKIYGLRAADVRQALESFRVFCKKYPEYVAELDSKLESRLGA
jgi:hypothetical protein